VPDRIDVNVEVGESFGRWPGGDDAASLAVVSSASVACGFHAGDYNAMLRIVELAGDGPVALGAHPGYPDLMGFGYRRLDMTPREIRAMVLYQVGALQAMVVAAGRRLHHVKPHGALYLQTLVDPDVAGAVVDAVASVDPDLFVYTTAGTVCEAVATAAGLGVVTEFFPDRPLSADGSLLVNWADHFDPSPANVAARVASFLDHGAVPAVGGGMVAVSGDCLCVHTDNPAGAAVPAAVVDELRRRGVTVAAPQPVERPGR